MRLTSSNDPAPDDHSSANYRGSKCLGRAAAVLWRRFGVVGAILLFAALPPAPAQSDPETATPACYSTAGGALEICRSAGEPEGVFHAPPSCRFASDVQILHLNSRFTPGPIQVVFQAEPRRQTRRGKEDEECDDGLRALDPTAGPSVRSGRQAEQFATTMPPSAYRFWVQQARKDHPRRKHRRGRRARRSQEDRDAAGTAIRALAAATEGSAARNPMTVAGRDWAGDDYFYLFMIASEVVGQGRRHVLIQARSFDFESLDLRGRDDETDALGWVPFTPKQTGRRRSSRREMPMPAPVLDEAGKPITGHCVSEGLDVRGLVGSISVVDRTYHYFYTDVLPSDCNEPVTKRRMGLYLRTSKDLTAEKGWSAERLVVDALPSDTLIRVAQAKGMDRWVVAYSCFRPSTAQGGPVADICLHYTRDLSVGSIADLSFYAEPASAVRSPSYLGLRIGGDAAGRFGREGFYWMTDRYGNLDTPSIYPSKGGLMTWLDRRAPRADGSERSTLYGRPIYWSTWTVQVR